VPCGLRVWLPASLLDLFGRHNAPSEAVTRSAQILEQALKVMNQTNRFKGSASISNPAISSQRANTFGIVQIVWFPRAHIN
jgi:hypothetical protein